MKKGKFASLKWVKPKLPKVISPDLTLLAATPVGRALREAAAAFGFPKAGKVTKTPQQQAVELLQAAAEVEQALLVQYLYAAYSIDPTGPAAPLRRTVVQIAKEEMGHLITVQNLLLALGADPYFDRENVPLGGMPAGRYPFPLRFEPMSGDPLAKYVTTESMPLDSIADPDLKKKLKPIFERAEKVVGNVQHVGLLYAKLFWLFQSNDASSPYWPELASQGLPPDWHIPDSALKGLDDPRQVTPVEFGREPVTPSDPNADSIYVIEIHARSHALFALSLIARQGEGYQTGSNSHFARFFAAYDNFAGTLPAGVRKVPVNPNTAPKKQTKPEAEDSRITHTKSLRWAKLFDIRYQLLLMELWLGVWTDRSETGALGRSSLFDATIAEMKDRIRKIGGQFLPTIDLKDQDNQDRKAGATFGLPTEALPATAKSVKARMKELLTAASDLAEELKNLPTPNAPTSAESTALSAMDDADKPLRDALAGS
jgi:hypothetical protein